MSQSGKDESAVDQERLWNHLRVLCDEIGPRLSGTPGDERAVEYIAEHFRRCGAEVEVQDYPCPGWEHESTELALVGPGGPEALPALAQTFTEACDVEAELKGIRSRDELELAPELEGKVLLLHGKIASSLTPDRNALLLAAEERRPAALVAVDPHEAVSSKLVRDPFLRVPAAAVGRSVGQKLLDNEGQRLQLRIRARRYDSTGHNVIGRFPGTQEGHVAVPAHYDSAAESPGASDNASGTATVLEACELFASARQDGPGVHFIAYGAEEYGRRGGGCLGSVEYVRRHPAETSQMLAVLEPDCVGTVGLPPRAGVMGFEASQREGIMGVFKRFPRYEVNPRAETDTPHTPFDLTGAPAVWFVNDYTRLPIHAAEDTLDVLSPEEMAFTVEVLSALLRFLLSSSGA